MTNKIRIIYLIDTISSNMAGTEKQLLNIIERLDKDQFEIILLCLYESNWMLKNRLSCETICLDYQGFLKPGIVNVIRKYLHILKVRNIDVVQTFFEDSMIIGAVGKLLSRKDHSLVISRRDLGLGSDEPFYHKFYKKLRPIIFNVSDNVVVNANAIKLQLSKYVKRYPDKFKVIANGIDCPSPPKKLPLVFDFFKADVWIGIVANLKPVKRIDMLLRSLAYMKENAGEQIVRVLVLGEGRLEFDLLQLAKDLGVSERVHFAGAVDNVSDYLYGLDIGVLCSDKEGLSNAILEYMACGLPVVVTDTGGNSELVDESNGFCVTVGDYRALGDALIRLVKSPSLRNDMAVNSYRKLRNSYTWNIIMPQWMTYYRLLARQKNN